MIVPSRIHVPNAVLLKYELNVVAEIDFSVLFFDFNLSFYRTSKFDFFL